MHVETLSIGSELVAGAGIDTNIAWIARQIAPLGLSLARHTMLPDDLEPLARFIDKLGHRIADRPAALLVTGGLGPTLDDLTRDAVARAFGVPLVEDAASREAIAAFFRKIGRPLVESNFRQALMPDGATPLPNAVGTAPGFHAARDDIHLFCMPGVPAEMHAMFATGVLPVLRRLAPPGRAIRERMLRTFGLGESTVGTEIADLMAPGRNPAVGTLASSGLVTVRLRAAAATDAEADALLEADEAVVRERLGPAVIGRDDERLPEAVTRLLRERGATLGIAESCTGGMIGAMVTDVPGASDVFVEGVVSYANRSKIARLGVPAELIDAHGAVSAPVARAMAKGLRQAADVSYALATTGIAGPTGGTDAKPVGTVIIALAGSEGTSVVRHVFPGDRDRVRRRTAQAALDLLRRRLLGCDPNILA